MKRWRAHSDVSRMFLVDEPSTLLTITPSGNNVGLWRATIPNDPQPEEDGTDDNATSAATESSTSTKDSKVESKADGDSERPKSSLSAAASRIAAAKAQEREQQRQKQKAEMEKGVISNVFAAVEAAKAEARRIDQVGQELGRLDSKRFTCTGEWKMPKLQPQQQERDLNDAATLLKTDYFVKNQFASDDNRRAKAPESEELIRRVTTSYGSLKKKGRVIEKSPVHQKHGEIRGAILGQMYGLRTWKETAMESSWNDTLEEEKRSQQQKIVEHQRRREAVLAAASKEAREVAEYSELLNTDLDSHRMVRHTIRSSLPVPWLPANDSENWGINSLNRQKRMYVNLFDTNRRRKQMEERFRQQRRQQSPSAQNARERVVLSLNEKIQWSPSSFLTQQFEKRLQHKKALRLQRAGSKAAVVRRVKSVGALDTAKTVKSSPKADSRIEEPEKHLTEEEKRAAIIAAMDAKFKAFESSNSTENAQTDSAAATPTNKATPSTTASATDKSDASFNGDDLPHDAIDTAVAAQQ